MNKISIDHIWHDHMLVDPYFEKAARYVIDKGRTSIAILSGVLGVEYDIGKKIMQQLESYHVVLHFSDNYLACMPESILTKCLSRYGLVFDRQISLPEERQTKQAFSEDTVITNADSAVLRRMKEKPVKETVVTDVPNRKKGKVLKKPVVSLEHNKDFPENRQSDAEFELRCRNLLSRRGYSEIEKAMTCGVSFFAYKFKKKHAVMCINSHRPLVVEDIRRFHRQGSLCDADAIVVISNGTFSKLAVEEAKRLKITLFGGQSFSIEDTRSKNKRDVVSNTVLNSINYVSDDVVLDNKAEIDRSDEDFEKRCIEFLSSYGFEGLTESGSFSGGVYFSGYMYKRPSIVACIFKGVTDKEIKQVEKHRSASSADIAFVITNNTVDVGAKIVANKLHVLLWDENDLKCLENAVKYKRDDFESSILSAENGWFGDIADEMRKWI